MRELKYKNQLPDTILRPQTSAYVKKNEKDKLQKVYEQAKLQYKMNVTKVDFKGDLNDE